MPAPALKKTDFSSYSEMTAQFTTASNAVVIDAMNGPCRITSLSCHIAVDSPVTMHYLKIYDSLVPVLGVTEPDYIIPILPSATANQTRNASYPLPSPIQLNNGLSFFVSAAPGLDLDPVQVNVDVKITAKTGVS